MAIPNNVKDFYFNEYFKFCYQHLRNTFTAHTIPGGRYEGMQSIEQVRDILFDGDRENFVQYVAGQWTFERDVSDTFRYVMGFEHNNDGTVIGWETLPHEYEHWYRHKRPAELVPLLEQPSLFWDANCNWRLVDIPMPVLPGAPVPVAAPAPVIVHVIEDDEEPAPVPVHVHVIEDNEEPGEDLVIDPVHDCPCCYRRMEQDGDPMRTPVCGMRCRHFICLECLLRVMSSPNANIRRCPVCRANMT